MLLSKFNSTIDSLPNENQPVFYIENGNEKRGAYCRNHFWDSNWCKVTKRPLLWRIRGELVPFVAPKEHFQKREVKLAVSDNYFD